MATQLKESEGVAATPPGLSAKPEPKVSALRASVPNATLASAMAAAFSEIEGATKSTLGQVGQQKYKYADLTSVIEAIKPALIANGLYFTQRPQPSEGGVTVETVIGHVGGEEMSLGALFVPANKNDAQAFGSALTYARRYALVTAFGVPVEDDDGNAASRPRQTVEQPMRKVADADFVLIQKLCQAVGGNQESLILDAYKIKTLPDLTPSQAQAVIGKLQDKLAARAKAETDAKAGETVNG